MIYLIPSYLAPDARETILPYVMDAVQNCQVIFAENERTARRFLKSVNPDIVIDDYIWYSIGRGEQAQTYAFRTAIKSGQNIAIISEAGCPGVADPGQVLVEIAQKEGVQVKPLVGPNSILLALMGSGLNGQHFCFHGYLPIDETQRIRQLKKLESESQKNTSTHIFIETPFRNNKLVDTILAHCQPGTRLCIAADLTAPQEFIQTKTTGEWKKARPDLHKRTAIFLINSSR